MAEPATCPITALIVALDDSPELRGVLPELKQQAETLGGEVLLVMNRAPEAYPSEVRAELAKACDRLAFEPTPGKSAALNRGVELARGEVVAFTDDDTDPQPGWLHALCAPLLDPGRDPALVAVGGPVVPIFDPEVEDWFREFLAGVDQHFLGPKHLLGDEERDYPTRPGVVADVPFGANTAARRELFQRFRYDPALGPSYVTGLRGGEETLLGNQILRAGLRIRYLPGAVVRHPVKPERASLAFVVDSYRAHGRAWIILLEKLGEPLPSVGYLTKRLYKDLRGRVRRRLKRRSKPEAELKSVIRRAELRGMLSERLRRWVRR